MRPFRRKRRPESQPKAATFDWAKVARRGPDECWPWTGGVNSWGYGQVQWRGKATNASRAAYEDVNGPVGSGLVVCHRCDNPICCNPAHLWAGTQAENLADCRAKGRQRYLRGADHHRATARLSDDDVVAIRRAVAAGEKQADVATRYGVHPAHVSRIASRKMWKHVA